MNLNRASLHADILSERYASHSPSFTAFMQAEFILYLRSAILNKGDYGEVWWPQSLMYSARQYHPFEVFARAESASYFDGMKSLLAVESADVLRSKVSDIQSDQYIIPRYNYSRLDVARLSNLSLLASAP